MSKKFSALIIVRKDAISIEHRNYRRKVVLTGKKMLRWLPRFFTIRIPERINNEVTKHIEKDREFRKERGNYKELYFEELKREKVIKAQEPRKECRSAIRKHVAESGIKEKPDTPDIDCAALALEMSRKEKHNHIFLISSDLPAQRNFHLIFREERIGTVLSSLDSLVYIVARNKSISKYETKKTIEEFLDLFLGERDRDRRLPELFKRSEYASIIEEMCRFSCKSKEYYK